jgi:hypothetical protein
MAHDHSASSAHPIVPGFGADRAAHYDTQAAVAPVRPRARSRCLERLHLRANQLGDAWAIASAARG